MILSRLDPRLALIVRIVGTGFVTWSVIAASKDAPGLHGRPLAVLVLLVVTVGLTLDWIIRFDSRVTIGLDTYVLALAAGGLIGAAPYSAASAFVLVALASAALRAELPRAMQVAGLATLGLAVTVFIWDGGAITLLAYALGFAAITLGASNFRQFRVRADQAELLLAQSQRSQEEQLRSARLEESARIAREIHDVLAHSLAGLSIQLEATTALIEGDADRDAILARVRRAHELARDGLRETRRAVGALRGDPVAVPEALQALAGDHRSADGRPAQLRIDGDRARLDGDAGLAVLRVVQEALTNVTKHAPGAEVTVTVDAGHGPEPIVAVIADGGAPIPVGAGSLAASGGGFGLRGMRERAAALGGTVSAGPADDGWRVELRLPAPPPAPTGPAASPGPTATITPAATEAVRRATRSG